MSLAFPDNASKTRPPVQDPGAVSRGLQTLGPMLTQHSLELARRVGNEPPLVGLIRVYKDYYPDVIVGEVASSRASVFTVRRDDQYILDEMLIISASKLGMETESSQNSRRSRPENPRRSSKASTSLQSCASRLIWCET